MGRANQGGSILSFVIIGGILMTLLVGGAYAVQQRSAQSDSSDSPVAVQSDEAPTTEEKEPAVQEEKSEPAPKEEAKEAPVKPAPKEAEKPKVEQKITPEAKPAPTSEKQPAPVVTPAPVTPRTTGELPQTGPVETLSSLVGLGLLSAVSVAYVRSRRP